MKLPHLKPSRRGALHAVLSAAAAMPLSLSLAAHAVGPAARPITKNVEDRPALAFDQYMVNYGAIEPRNVVAARFGFTNRGRFPVEIRELKPSCGCLHPELPKRTFQPGESGEFYLRVLTANQDPGPHEYFVDVMYEDPEPQEARLTFKVVLPQRQVTVRPKALICYQLSGEPTLREVVVTDYRGNGLTLTGVRSTSELVSAEIGPAERGPGGIRRIPVEVTVQGRIPPGSHRALLTLQTNDPEYPQLRVPLMIRGPDAESPRSAHREGHGIIRR